MLLQDTAFDGLFKRMAVALKPYASELVCIGGCANALYRHHPLAAEGWPAYLGTMDVDWAVRQPLPLTGSSKRLTDLMAEAGFIEELTGSGTKPVVKYRSRSGEGAATAEVEFLCPLSGVRGARGGHTASTEVQSGLYAQPLRYLDLLLYQPWEVDLATVPGFADLSGLLVRVPNPAAYFIQKILIRSQRRESELMAKDCYYMYEIAVIFRKSLGELNRAYKAMEVHSPVWAKWLSSFRVSSERLFKSAVAEGPTSAVRVQREAFTNTVTTETVSPEMVYLSVRRLLDVLC